MESELLIIPILQKISTRKNIRVFCNYTFHYVYFSDEQPMHSFFIKFVVLGGSPVHKKSHSSMTQHSYSTTRSGSKEGKDGDTPTDSEGSLGKILFNWLVFY